jgi:hypothetical protein
VDYDVSSSAKQAGAERQPRGDDMRMTRFVVAVSSVLVAASLLDASAVPQSAPQAESQRSNSESQSTLLVKSKSMCVVVPTDSVSAEVMVKLAAWGKLTLVPGFSGADLIMEITRADEPLKAYSEFRLEDAQRGTAFTARVRHRRSGVQLWSTAKGGNSERSLPDGAWAARQIAEEFTAFFDGAARAGQKRK